MDVKRAFHERVKEAAEDFPAIGIIGARQTGKTTLAKNLSRDWDITSVYIDLENPQDLVQLTDPMIFFESHKDHCVILDEVQVMPELFRLLRPIIDQDRRPGRFILLGSVSPEIIRGTSESLAGRIAYEELAPLLLTELTSEDLQKHWLRGGYPLSFLARDDKRSATWRINYLRTYSERDLPQFGLAASARTIQTLWSMLAHLNGNLLNTSVLSRSMGLTHPTVTTYLDFLEGAFLIRRLQPFHFNIKKRLVRTPKLYFRDTGLLHQLLNVAKYQDLIISPHVGASWENYVVEQICNILHNKYDFYFYRTHQGTECDLVLVEGLQPKISIEIKFSSAPKLTRGYLQAIEDLGTERNVIIAPVKKGFGIHPKVEVMTLTAFLQSEL
ncbi:MAG: ATP-binding protein [Cyclobacteriaceae bacterium]